MATGCPHPLAIDFKQECPLEHAARAEYGAHWILAHKWHFGEWFAVSAEEAIDAIQKAIAWAISEAEHPYELLGPQPTNRLELGEWLINCRMREQAYKSQPYRMPERRQRAATLASQRARHAWKAKRIEIAKPKWHDHQFTVEDISRECGLSRRTLYNELGPRWEDESAQHA